MMSNFFSFVNRLSKIGQHTDVERLVMLKHTVILLSLLLRQ